MDTPRPIQLFHTDSEVAVTHWEDQMFRAQQGKCKISMYYMHKNWEKNQFYEDVNFFPKPAAESAALKIYVKLLVL